MFSFPANCITPADRTEYTYRYQELLRLLHNVMGTWYREGISETTWSKLPVRIQERYPYKVKLTKEEWADFQLNIFTPASNKIVGAILGQRALLKQSKRWEIDTEALI